MYPLVNAPELALILAHHHQDELVRRAEHRRLVKALRAAARATSYATHHPGVVPRRRTFWARRWPVTQRA